MIERVRERYVKYPFQFLKDAYQSRLKNLRFLPKDRLLKRQTIRITKRYKNAKNQAKHADDQIPIFLIARHPKQYSSVPEPVRMAFARTESI